MSRRLSLPVPSEGVLARVATSPRALGMWPGRTRYELIRETYFDTADRSLADRRLSLRLRLEATGIQTVELLGVTGVNLQGVVEERLLLAPVVGGGLYATLSGDSELATRVREVVDPVGLRPLLAVDIDREIRELRRRWLGNAVFRLTCDRMVAHQPGRACALQEVAVTETGTTPGRPSLEVLADRLARHFGLTPDGMDTLERGLTVLERRSEPIRADTPREVRMALLLLHAGSVALCDTPEGLALPTARGTGEELAAGFVRELEGPGGDGPEVELVGFATSGPDSFDLEVWLHEHSGGGPVGGDLLWIPLAELLERVGAPRLRRPGLVAALLLLVHSEIGLRLVREAPAQRTAPVSVPLAVRPQDAKRGSLPEDFLDTELSILDFNQRVLELAEDPSVPLLERFRFLAIFASNMDEFFVVRVGRLKTAAAEARDTDEVELPGVQLLDLIAVRVRALMARQYSCLRRALLPALAERGVRLRRWSELDGEARASLSRRFESEIFPLLTPRAMSASPGHPFPRLESLRLALAVLLRDPAAGASRIAHVPIPDRLPRFLAVAGGPDLIAVEDVIEANAAALFPSLDVAGIHAFRVSRLGDVDIDGDVSGSLLASVEDEVQARPFKPVVRLEVQRAMPREVGAHLLRELRSETGTDSGVLTRADLFEVDGPLDLRGFMEVAELDLPGERYPRFEARRPLDPGRSVFQILDEGDVLVHHPYDSFDGTVGRFLCEAARDPDVAAIKVTLYRTGRDSPLGGALLEALANGKEVSVFVELQARFDEESNIQWTRRLTEAGGHVVYGVVGFKNHAKTALVVRRRGEDVRRYVHVGTGNYNAATARVYTDLGLMSAAPELGADVNDFFNELTGSSGPPAKTYRRLWVAPRSLAPELLRRIEGEVAHARAGRPARIQAKLNGLTDRRVVKALYAAAGEGVQIDLVVRAICTLRPGVPGLSETIRVRSILGRFLEHARIYYFEDGGAGAYYIGSADWRKRNLRKRVEVAAHISGDAGRATLRAILDAELADPRAWVLRPDGTYARLGGEGPAAQEIFLP